MIAANELRIGNWVQHVAPTFYWTYRTKGKDVDKPFCFQWEEEDWYAVGECKMYYGALQPIPLTPEILEKAGFAFRPDTVPQRWNKPMIGFHSTFYLYVGKEGVLSFSPAEWNWTQEIKYVHQLQNLYFALTQEELPLETI
jgi:hypothetical protein